MSSYRIDPLKPEVAEKLDAAFGMKDAFVEFNPGKCLLPPFYEQIAQQILDAPVREDDIWLLGYPRTGSTWCQEMVWLLGNDMDFKTAENTIQQIRAPLIEMSTIMIDYYDSLSDLLDNSVDYVNSLPSPRYIKSHLPLELLPSEMDKIKPKIVYTCRNPKDMCVSLHYHCKMAHHFEIEFEEFCDLFIKGLTPYGPIWPHYLTFWNKRHEPNVLLLKYEEMNRDFRGTLKKIAKFLGKQYIEEQYDAAVDFLSFQKMRNNKGCNLQDVVDRKYGKNYYERKGIHFFRKGIVGDWKNHMSPELSKRFDDWIEENTRGTGLTFE